MTQAGSDRTPEGEQPREVVVLHHGGWGAAGLGEMAVCRFMRGRLSAVPKGRSCHPSTQVGAEVLREGAPNGVVVPGAPPPTAPWVGLSGGQTRPPGTAYWHRHSLGMRGPHWDRVNHRPEQRQARGTWEGTGVCAFARGPEKLQPFPVARSMPPAPHPARGGQAAAARSVVLTGL